MPKNQTDKPTFTVRQVRSQIGCTLRQRETLKGLGLGRIGKQKTLIDTPASRGLVAGVHHLVHLIG